MQRARFEVDLHSHTTFSDGQLSPTELVALAARRGVTHLAITDHDTMDGLPEAHQAGAEHGITVIDGVELSVWADKELHLLGFFVDAAHPPLAARLAARKTARIDRIHAIVDKLAALGKRLDVAAILASADGNPGRPHVARAMIEAGHVRSHNEAFQRFLGSGQPAYVPTARLAMDEAIALVHAAGGVAALAHPGVEGVDPKIEGFAAAGLDGIECHHPAHDAAQAHHYQVMADLLGLCVTGGSDFHGPANHAGPGSHGLERPLLDRIRRR